MSSDSNFKWYSFYEVGCELLEKEDSVYWRTAIGRFYYAAFCEAKDFLIYNNIYCNKDLKSKLTSGKGVVHSATQDIFKYSGDLNSHNGGRFVSDKLRELRDYRNVADYDSDARDFKNMAFRAKSISKAVFSKLDDLV